MSGIRWSWSDFDRLSPAALYAILELRSRVFVVEQNCAFLDLDGLDAASEHLCGDDGHGRLRAYLRLVPPRVKYPEPSLGRLVSDPAARNAGLAREAMRRGLARCAERFPGQPVRLGAQRYLEKFYGSLGFVAHGAPYLEDGIPHIEMVKR